MDGGDKMEQLGDLIMSKTFKNQSKCNYRLASRAIIYQDGKVLLIHSKFYNDYTFPGGGVEFAEDEYHALVRECQEEAGVVIENARLFCKTVEKREMDNESYMLQESHFYLCDVKEMCPTRLESYEVDLGYEPVWITVDEAIKNNEAKRKLLKSSDYDGVLERELRVLHRVKEYFMG